MLSAGPQGLVASRDKRLCTYHATVLLNLKLLNKDAAGDSWSEGVWVGFGVPRLGVLGGRAVLEEEAGTA